MGKTYRSPKVLKTEKGGGYPQADIDRKGTMRKGAWGPDSGQKSRKAMRGKGAATKGFMFYDED